MRLGVARRRIGWQSLQQLGQLVQVERLDQVRVEPRLSRAPPVGLLTPTCQGDERNTLPPGLGTDSPRHLVAIELGHTDVEKRHLG